MQIVDWLAEESLGRRSLAKSVGIHRSSYLPPTCRSTVMTWSMPALESRLARRRAVIAPRCDFFFDCLE